MSSITFDKDNTVLFELRAVCAIAVIILVFAASSHLAEHEPRHQAGRTLTALGAAVAGVFVDGGNKCPPVSKMVEMGEHYLFETAKPWGYHGAFPF